MNRHARAIVCLPPKYCSPSPPFPVYTADMSHHSERTIHTVRLFEPEDRFLVRQLRIPAETRP